jgi:hypothetical protein
MTFSFGQSERERIEVDVPSRERAPVDDYDWMTVAIRVQAGGFQGDISAAILSDDLVRFASQLRPLYQTLSGTAEFSTMEDQLRLRLVGDGNGHIALQGEVADRPGDGNRFYFHLEFDQSQLGASIRELEKITSQIPSRVA